MNPLKTSDQSTGVGHPTVLDPVIASLQKELGDNLVALVLFGSRARGDHRPDSDWDILLIARQLPDKPFQRHLYLKRTLPGGWRGQVAILAKTPAEFEAHLPALFLDIALDGMILHDTDDYVASRLARLRLLIQEQGLYREGRGTDLIWQWQEFPGLVRQLTWQGMT